MFSSTRVVAAKKGSKPFEQKKKKKKKQHHMFSVPIRLHHKVHLRLDLNFCLFVCTGVRTQVLLLPDSRSCICRSPHVPQPPRLVQGHRKACDSYLPPQIFRYSDAPVVGENKPKKDIID